MLAVPRFLVTSLVVTLCVGCASLPKTGVQATGEPLWVKYEEVDDSYVTKERVGEVEHRDSQGNVVGTSAMYQEKVVHQTRTEWRPMQGQHVIDVQDFFRIAGDEQRAADIEATRSRGLILNRTGWGLVVAGGLAAISGYFLMSNPDTSSVGAPAVYGGLGAGLGGYALTWLGSMGMNYDGGATDALAHQTAQAYNQSRNLESPNSPAMATQPSANLRPGNTSL